MKLFEKSIFIIVLILLICPFMGFSQNDSQKDSVNHNAMNAAREIMASSTTCSLITIDEKGIPLVRLMDPFPTESDFTVWFGTNPKSRKVNQIKKNPIVTLYYIDSNASGYVVIHGRAKIVNDQREKEKRWKVEWESFYPNKKEDYALIKVSPEWMEVLSPSRGILGDPTTWQAPVIYFHFNK